MVSQKLEAKEGHLSGEVCKIDVGFKTFVLDFGYRFTYLYILWVYGSCVQAGIARLSRDCGYWPFLSQLLTVSRVNLVNKEVQFAVLTLKKLFKRLGNINLDQLDTGLLHQMLIETGVDHRQEDDHSMLSVRVG